MGNPQTCSQGPPTPLSIFSFCGTQRQAIRGWFSVRRQFSISTVFLTGFQRWHVLGTLPSCLGPRRCALCPRQSVAWLISWHLEFCLSLVSSVQPLPLVLPWMPILGHKTCAASLFPLLCSFLARLFSSLLPLVSDRLSNSVLWPPCPQLSGDFLPYFPCLPPSVCACKSQGEWGTFAWHPPPTSCPDRAVGVTVGKAGRAQGQPTECRAVVVHSCHHLPSGPHNHFETQVAEGGPDMPLCLSPARLDGPHVSCLVSWRLPGM